MDEAQRNSEIEKIANQMIHDGVSPDEQDVEKLSKYKDQVKSDCNLDDEKAMELVYEALLYRKLKTTDTGDIIEKSGDFGAGFS